MLLEYFYRNTRLLALALASVGLISFGALAQDDPPEDPDDPEVEELEESNPAWDDPARLAEVIARDQTEERDALQEQLDNEEITQEEFDLAIAALDQDLADLDALIAELSPEQLYALNKFLNDTFNNGRSVFLNAELLQMIIDEEYGDREIRLLTKGLEEEYKFTQFAERAAAKAEATGNDKFLDQELRFRDRAENQRDKFHDRIGEAVEESVEESIQSSLTEELRGQAKAEAKRAAREAAKDEVRGQAKAEARHAAKEAAKAAAKNN